MGVRSIYLYIDHSRKRERARANKVDILFISFRFLSIRLVLIVVGKKENVRMNDGAPHDDR